MFLALFLPSADTNRDRRQACTEQQHAGRLRYGLWLTKQEVVHDDHIVVRAVISGPKQHCRS